MKDIFRVRRMWRPRGQLKKRYDVVIIGGGSHGLATAYYLAKNHGITNVAILEKSYIGSGAAGRNTTIIRSNYRTPQGAQFYRESVRLYEGLSADLDFNMLFSQQGHLTLAHSDRGIVTANERAEVNQVLGIDSRVIYPDEIAKLCPEMDLSDKPTWPVLAALYHPPGGIIRHDAVVWGFARGADRGGAEIHPYTEVTDVLVDGGKVRGVETNRGTVEADWVVSAVAGWSTLIGDMAGVPLPITTHILQAAVTEPLKPFLEYSAKHILELFPQLEHARLLRTWTGLCDLSPDYSPILGMTEVEKFLVSTGWGTYGFKAAPVVGKMLAETVATNRTPDLIAPFALERFYTDSMVSELAAAAVSH